jgi:archaellum biogenesis ATPase FlaH
MYKTGEKLIKNMLETVEDVNSYPILAIEERGLTEETCKRFGVRTALSEQDGKTPIAHYFPYTKKGKIVGYKKRDLTKPKSDKYHFTAVGEVKIDCELFGQSEAPTGGKKVFITEGCYDQLSAYQVLKAKYPSGEPAVVSIGLGTANAAAHIGNNLKFLDNFSETIIAFDMDSATEAEKKKGIKKGKEAVQDVAQLIPDIKVAEFSENDPSDMLMSGKADQLYWSLVSKAKQYVPEEISIGGDISLDSLLEPLKEGVYIDCFPKLMQMIRGFRQAELTVFLAPSGAGKTTVTKEIGYSLVKKGNKVGHIFLEEDIKKSQQSYIALDNNILLPELRKNPAILDKEKAGKSFKELIDNDKTIWLSHFGSITNKNLMDKMRYMAAAGAEYIILDHLSMVVSGQETDNERRLIDQLLTELAAFVTATKVHVIAVAHIKRKDFQPPRNKDTKEIEYPYWIPVNKEDARGSGAFEQLAFQVITIEPEIIDEAGTRGKIRMRVQKSREWGEQGITDIVIMDRNTGRLVNAEETISF